MSFPQIACPICSTKYPFDAALAGKKVKCANCGHMFYQPAKATIEPAAPTTVALPNSSATPAVAPPFMSGPPPYVAPPSIEIAATSPIAAPPIAAPIVEPAAEPAKANRPNGPTGFFDFLRQLFDFRVEKYLTLYIVRLYWFLALVAVGLYLGGVILSLVLEGPQTAFRPPTSEDSLLELLGQSRQSTSEYAGILNAYDRFKWFSLKVIFGISSVLMVRVWCEVLVVAFNIANSLRSIEQKIDALDRKE
jgi:predicted Zn finger-like uncharacterized protein